MSTFFAGLLAATLLTVAAIYVYDLSHISRVDDVHMPGVHAANR
jgi:hypothetical protein